MRHFSLIGYPLGHSFSAKYFSEKFSKLKIDACYSLLEAPSIEEALQKAKSCEGFNVTIPFKEKIIPFLQKLSPEAGQIGAVNCVKVENGRMTGFNTDVRGIESTLDKIQDKELSGALILGTGGASKAVQYVLQKRMIPFRTVSRDRSRGITYKEVTAELMRRYPLIINATPIGMSPKCDAMPEINPDYFTAENTVFDLVYNPDPTLLMQVARNHGAIAISGMEMLLKQAEVSWQIWNGIF